MTHICVSELSIIGLDNCLSPGRRQAIIWTSAGTLLIRTLGINFSEIFGEMHTFSFKEMYSKMSSGKRRPFCLGLNVLSVCFNSFRPGDFVWRHRTQWIGSDGHSCRWQCFCTKPIPEITLTYCRSDPSKQTSAKYKSKHDFFYLSRKYIWHVSKLAVIWSRHQCVHGKYLEADIRFKKKSFKCLINTSGPIWLHKFAMGSISCHNFR